ncbi:hypothetical protein Tco_0478242 [Tanacetum coccineum]
MISITILESLSLILKALLDHLLVQRMSPLFLLKALAVLMMLVLLMGFLSSCESNSSTETLESVPEPVVVKPNVVSQPKVWPDAPIIEEYESDSDDEYVIQPSKEHERPSFAFIDTVKHVKTSRDTVKEQNTYINTAGVKAVSDVRGIKETAVKPSADPTMHDPSPKWLVDVPGTCLETRPTLLNIKTIIVAMLLLELCDIENKINEELVDQEDQAFLEELERLKRQEKEANDVAGALRKEFAQDNKDLLLQAGAAKANHY